MKAICVAIAMMVGFAASAYAEREWTTVGSVKAAEGTKEVRVNQAVSKVAIECTDGSVTITALTVRDGAKRIPFSFTSRLNKGEIQQVTIGDKINVSSIVIEDDGRGAYDVKVKK